MKLFLIQVFFIIGSCLFAQQQSLLYKISGKDAKESYLFGTMHLLPDSLFYFPEKLEKVIRRTQELVLEIDNLKNVQHAQDLMQLSEGSCFDIFTNSQKDSVIHWGATLLKLSNESFEKSFSNKKPFVLLQIGLQNMVSGPVRMLELELIKRANSNKISISGLESMEFQIGLFDSLPDSIMCNLVMDQVRYADKNREEYQKMALIYHEQNLDSLTVMIQDSDEFSDFENDLITHRNLKWLDIIETKIKTTKCFIAVGAGHLGGEQGLLKLLIDKGYKITPVYY